jgi:hypothetical protein
MAYLKNILNEYRKLIEGIYMENFENKELKIWKQIDRKVQEGDVFEVPSNNIPNILAVYKAEGDFSDVVPLCPQWELATKKDLLIDFHHILRNKWIAELDLVISIPNYILYQSEYAGRLKKEDVELIKQVLNGEKNIPRNRTGLGYDDDIHREFKEIERERHKWLFNELLSCIEETQMETIEIIPPLKELIKSIEPKKLVAATETNTINKDFGVIIYNQDEKSINVFFKDKFLGETGEIFFKEGEDEVTIYIGVLRDFSIRHISRELFRILADINIRRLEDS